MSNLFCSIFKIKDDFPIPEKLQDKTTYLEKNCHQQHSWYSHLFCVILRIILAILIANGYFNRWVIVIFAILVILVFGNKFINNPNTWKIYLRTVMAYTAIGSMEALNITNANTISAGLIIADALMGIQSRYQAYIY